MKVTLKGTVKYVSLLALSAVLLYFAFRGVSWSAFMEGLRSCNWWWILATIALQWLITYLRGNRWRIMMRPLSKEITRRETYDAYAVCYLANMVFPRSGEVVRCGLIADTHKATFEGSLGTVVIERTWDLLCVVLACLPLFFIGRFRDFIVEKMIRPTAESMNVNWLWIIVAAAVAVAIICVIVWIFRERISATKAGAKIKGFLKGLVDGVKAGFRMEKKWAFFGYTVLIWAGYWMTSLWTIRAFPGTASMDLLDALFLMVVGSLGWIVPVPGGVGAYHFIVAMTLVPIYGFDYNTGIVFATISHESQLVQMLLCGLVSLVSWAIYKRKVLSK